MSNIDWDFISAREGKGRTSGYVPDADGSDSGVTIATGFDLGARNINDLKGLPKTLIEKLTPYLGIKGAQAEEIASNLNITDPEAKTIDEFSKKEATDRLKAKWQAATGNPFDDLPKNKATVIASVAFQYGDLESKTPNFWRQVTSDDWDAAEKNLRNFGDNYSSRRNLEADYFIEGLSEEELAAKKKFERELRTDVQYGIQEARIFEGRDRGDFEDLGTEPTAKVDDRPFPTERLDDEVIPVPPVASLEPLQIEDDGVNLISVTRPSDPKPEPVRVYEKPVTIPGESYAQMVDRLIEQDLAEAGPVVQTLRENQFGEAGLAMFTDNSAEIRKAAFDNLNPIAAAGRLINDMLRDVDDDPDYDFAADPQLKGREDSWWRFYDSKSAAETSRRLERFDQELENQAVLNSSDSTGQQLAAAFLTPTTLLPLAPLRYMAAPGVFTRFAAGATFSAAPVATEQLILGAANETRTLEEASMAVALASIVGGSANAAFGKYIARSSEARYLSQRPDDEPFYAGGGNAGAMMNPDSPLYRETMRRNLELDAAKETGIGVEKTDLNPVLRMLKSSNPFVRGITAQMVDMGGVMQKKVDAEIAMDQGLEKIFAARFNGPLVEALRESNKAYLAYRGAVARPSDSGQALQIMGYGVKDKFKRNTGFISEAEFRIRVGEAGRRGDVDTVGDAASPFVTQAAKQARGVFNLVVDEAQKVRLFESEIQRAIASAKAAGDDALVNTLKERLKDLREKGVTLNTAESYIPRLFRIDRIEANPDKFKMIIRQYGNEKLGLRGADATKFVDDIYDTVTRQRPFIFADEAVENIEGVVAPGSAKARELEIPDEVLEEFLESDIEVLLRHHVRTMGMDIEIARKFGSIDMKGAIDQITEEWQRMIAATKDPAKKDVMRKQMANDLRDVRALRDRIRGTYGASKDPHAMSSRFVRAMKSFNVITLMGGAAVSSIPDVVRVVMVEGFQAAYGKGLKRAFKDNGQIIKKLKQRELNQAGVAADAVLGLRAQAMSDVGDIFGNRTAAERFLNQSAAVMFFINGLNMMNQFLKEFAGGVTTLRMTEAIMQPWGRLRKADKEKLLKNGIDQQMHMRMQMLIKKHGEQIDGEWLPNTELWGAAGQAERITFRTALNQNVDRIIITPGAGDRALWTSTEFGSLLTQFKSFGQAATMRLLISGLQERDGAFWQGAFLLVGAGAMVNEIKRRQYGIDKEETFGEKLINAVDRSGLLGSFMDINNTVEKLSNYGYGIRPALLEDQKRYMPPQAKIGAVFGPGSSQIMNLGGVTKDLMNGNFNQDTKDSMRFLQPFGNHPIIDPLLDRVYGQAK